MIEKSSDRSHTITKIVRDQENRLAEIAALQHEHKVQQEALIHDLIRGGHYDCFSINRRALHRKFGS